METPSGPISSTKCVNDDNDSGSETDTAKFLTHTKLPKIIPPLLTSTLQNNNGDEDLESSKLKDTDLEAATSPNSSNKDLTTKNGLPSKTKKIRTGWKRYIGILLGLVASMLFPLAGLIVKALPQYHPFSVTFWRFQGILLPAIPMAVYHRCVKKDKIWDSVLPLSDPGKRWTVAFLVMRGAVGASAVIFQFYSLQFISMADSSVISFSTPVFVTLVAHITLGEKCGVIPIISGLCALVGVIIIARPPMLTGASEFDTDILMGTALALGCMVCATSTFILLRYLRQLHYAMLNVFFGCWGTCESLLLSAIISTFHLPQGLTHWVMAVALAGISFITQTCMTLAFKFEQAATISLVRTCDVIFAFIWQFLILGVVPDRFSVVGACVVITGILLVGFRKWLSELPPEDHRRHTFSWILK